MTEDAPKKRVLTEEHKRKMQEGRRAAAERRLMTESSPESSNGSNGMVHTTSSEIRDRQAARTLEDVARRHTERSEEIDDAEDLAAIARSVELSGSYTPADDVPADEEDPLSRDKPTIGKIELRDEGDDELLTFEDLMAEYGRAIEVGWAYITVHRKFPKSFENIRVDGVQREIRQQITIKDFIEIYGGGIYELNVYGPSKRGGYKYDPVTGATKLRRLTKTPITLTIPLMYTPNMASALDEEEEQAMNEQLRGHGRLPLSPMRLGRSTTADAKIHETEVSYQERREQRMQEREERKKREQREADKKEEDRMAVMFQSMERNYARQLDEARRREDALLGKLDDMQERVQELLAQVNAKPERRDGEMFMEGISKILPHMMDNKSITADQARSIAEAAQKDKDRLVDSHREELRRLEENHRSELDRQRQELDRERRGLEDRINEIRRSSDDRVREIQEQAKLRVDEIERRSEKLVNDVRRESDQRVADIKSSYESRMSDLDRNHQTELRQLKETFDTRMEAVKSGHQSEVATREAELRRVSEELAQVREKANRPLHEQLEEFTETASAMGFSRSDGSDEPKDWKDMLADVGKSLVTNAPQLLETLRARQAPPQVAGAAQHRALPNPPQAPMAPPLYFATEDGPDLDGPVMSESHAPPVYPGGAPSTGPSRVPVPLDGSGRPQHTDRGAPSSGPIYPEAQTPPAAAAPAPPPQAVERRPPAPTPNPAAAPKRAPALQLSDEQVIEQSKAFAEAMAQGATAQQFVDHAVGQFGPDVIRAILQSIDPERILGLLEEDDPGSPLLRRDGKAFLRDVWDVAEQKLGLG